MDIAVGVVEERRRKVALSDDSDEHVQGVPVDATRGDLDVGHVPVALLLLPSNSLVHLHQRAPHRRR
jgi:hypothetical protein